MVETQNCPTCNGSIPGKNDCALTLSVEMGWKNKTGCTTACNCKYPIRAKDVRNNIFTEQVEEFSKAPSKLETTLAAQKADNAYIYCENEKG